MDRTGRSHRHRGHVIDKLNAAINEGQASLDNIGMQPTIVSPQEFTAFIAAETPRWTAVVKAAEIKVE